MTAKIKKPLLFLPLFALLMVMLMNFSFTASGITAKAAGTTTTVTPKQPTGTGTSADPYKIGTAAELYWFAGLVNGDGSVCDGTNVTQNTAACAELTADIFVNGDESTTLDSMLESGTVSDGKIVNVWTPIGNNDNQYSGTFNGKGNTISGLYCNDAVTAYVGLFGYLGSKGSISNVNVADSYFSSQYEGSNVGGVCGYSDCGTIESCSYNGTVKLTNYLQNAGGVCGDTKYGGGTIKNCTNYGIVIGYSGEAGGICAASYAEISGCKNYGKITGTSIVGGVCARNYSKITDCYNYGEIISKDETAGGICAINEVSYTTITNCHNEGNVQGVSYIQSGKNGIGGVCGWNEGSITDCSNSGKVTGGIRDQTNTLIGDNVGGVCGWNKGTITATVTTEDGKSIAKFGYNSGEIAAQLNNVGGVCGLNEGAIKNYSNKGNVTSTGYKENTYLGVSGGNYVGGVCGNNKGTITADIKCTNSGDIASTCGDYVGGVCGYNESCTITNYANSGNITSNAACGKVQTGKVDEYVRLATGGDYVGGVCGYSSQAITSCSSSGNITATAAAVDETVSTNSTNDTASGGNYVGGVCGYNEGAAITDCYNTGSVKAIGAANKGTIYNENVKIFSGDYVGGVCGYNKGTITSCYNEGTIENKLAKSSYPGRTSGRYIGGLCGYSVYNEIVETAEDGTTTTKKTDAAITDCHNKGKINAEGFYIGGVCGKNDTDSYIQNCYNEGIITVTLSEDGEYGAKYVGGLCGQNSGNVSCCYNKTAVSASDYVGGLCGLNYGPLTASYNIGTVTAKTDAKYVGGVYADNSGAGRIDRCYYLAETDDSEYAKTKTQFENGEVCYLLNNKTLLETHCKWGQTLNVENADIYPVFLNKSNKVWKVIFYVLNDGGSNVEYAVKYANADGVKQLPNEPKSDTLKFAEWQNSDKEKFTEETPIDSPSGIVYVYAYGKEIIIPEGDSSAKIEVPEGTAIADVDLNSYVKYAAGSADNFTFAINGESTPLPDGLTLDNGTITGTAGKIGRKSVTFDITNNSALKQMKHSDTASTDSLDNLTLTIEVTLPSGHSAESPYLINNLDTLKKVRDAVNDGIDYTGKYFKLGANIDLGGSPIDQWTPIGNSSTQFNGDFDGDGYTITSLFITGTNDYQGLFGYVGKNGTVKNLGVNCDYLSGSDYVGGVCGQNDGKITDCYSVAMLACSGNTVGSVCGSSAGEVTNCYYLADSETDKIDGTTYKTKDEFKSGAVCYLLNGDQSVLVWGQAIDTDTYPVKNNGNTVYYGYVDCNAKDKKYSNSELHEEQGHKFNSKDNYVCLYCYSPFAKLTANYAAIGAAVDKAREVAADGKIGSEVSVKVAADKKVLTCYIILNGSEPTVDSYELKIFKTGEAEPSEQTGISKYKKIWNNEAVSINMVQIIYDLDDNTTYTVELTLYDDAGNKICTQETAYPQNSI